MNEELDTYLDLRRYQRLYRRERAEVEQLRRYVVLLARELEEARAKLRNSHSHKPNETPCT